MSFRFDNFYTVNIWAYCVWNISYELLRSGSGGFLFLLWHNAEAFTLAPQQNGEVNGRCPPWGTSKGRLSLVIPTGKLVLYLLTVCCLLYIIWCFQNMAFGTNGILCTGHFVASYFLLRWRLWESVFYLYSSTAVLQVNALGVYIWCFDTEDY